MSEYLNPYTKSRRWLRGNLHAHTCCGPFMDATVSSSMFSNLGYDFLAITDHNRAPDEATLKAWQSQTNLILLPGEENGDIDHMLEIGVHEVSPTPGKDVFLPRANALREGPGFVAGCHPQEYSNGDENMEAGAGVLHAFEIFNGLRDSRGCFEEYNIELWDHILTQGKKIWGIATDDFHCAYISPGHGWVCVQVPEDDQKVTWQTIVSQLKAGAFFASTYPGFREISLEDNTLSVIANSQRTRMRVIGPGGESLHEEEGNKLNWRVVPNLAYFRIEVESGVKRAWSQPFFRAD